jgi:exonuclease III
VPLPRANVKKFPKLNFSCQNVCSLNVSKPNKRTHNKLATITRNKDDIIFICDTRLNSNRNIVVVNDVEKKLRFMGYNLYHNSKTSSRGAAMLISTKIGYNILDEYKDILGNILLLKIRIGNATLTVGSIYGPNIDDRNFFNTLSEITRRFNSDFCIIGGDWNTTLDGRPSNRNIDTLNIVNIPSERRSNWLNNLCTDLNLIDPFRHFYPDITAFTYVPFAEAATNRSRLDFFFFSSSLTQQCINCRIPHNLSSLMFDHKQVFLNFRPDNPYKKQTINDVILKDNDLHDIVNIAVIECYLNHILPSANLTGETLDRHRLAIGRVLNLQKSLNEVKLHIAMNGFDEEINANCELLKNSIRNHIDLIPSLDELQQETLSCGNDVFLEILIMSVKNSSLAHQHNLFKAKNVKEISY